MRKKKESTLPVGEKRKDSRVKEEDKIVIEVLSDVAFPQGKRIFNALTKDISPGGLRIMTNLALPIGTLIKMEIALPKRRKLILATGNVRWARSVYEEELFEMGVEFEEIGSEDKMILLEHTYRRK